MICSYCKFNSGSMCSNTESRFCAKPVRRRSDTCEDYVQEEFFFKRKDDVLTELSSIELAYQIFLMDNKKVETKV